MAKKLPKIRTPFYQHVRRFRYQVLPVLFFLAALGASTTLWDRQQSRLTATGEVLAISVNLASDQDGRLVTFTDSTRNPLLTTVKAGDIVAQLDSATVREEVAAMRSELASLRAEIEAKATELGMEIGQYQQSRTLDLRRLSLDVERQQLDLLDRQARLQTNRIALIQMQSELEIYQKANARGVETEYSVQNAEHLRDAAYQQVEGEQAAIATATAQLKLTQERLAEFGQEEAMDVQTDTILAPIRHSVTAQSARIRRLELLLDTLTIRSPVDGRITAIHYRPGQAIMAGEPILTVTALQSQVVVSYLREGLNYRPNVDDEVSIRRRGGGDPITGRIARVGSSIELVPVHQLRSPDRAEWGLPVSIAIPPAANLLPGELVEVSFARAR